jgi:hypothetical protein
MIVALIGYISTMVAAFVAVVVAWKAVIGPPQMEKVHQPPVAIGAVVQQASPAKQPGEWGPPVLHKADGPDAASADVAQTAAEKDAAEKAKRQQQARYQKRKVQLARQQQEPQQYSTALGYDQERSYDQQRGQAFSSGPLFNSFGGRRY